MEQFIDKYLSLLETKFSGLNLTRITDREDFKQKQYIDSLEPLKHSKIFKSDFDLAGLVLDVGFGGGFPLLPLAHAFPDKKFIGIEAREKKVFAVREIAKELDLANVTVYHQRLEDLVIDKPCLVLSKAVADVEKLLPMINSTEKISVYFYKGLSFKENENYQKILRTWDVREECFYTFNNSSVSRYIVGFQNKNVPCGTISKSKAEKKLFSSFI